MKIVNSIQELKRYLAEERQHNKQIGFVPTMGALHNGHLSLVKRCVEENDVCVVSVFVNPTQFNDKHDLETYPRTLDKDCTLLEPAGCDYVFAPSAEEMYPEPDTRTFDFGTVSAVMEGARRPGHFNGVAQIVSKLFYVVECDNGPDYVKEGLFRIMDEKGLMGFADSSGHIIITPQFKFAYPFEGGKAKVTFTGKQKVVSGSDGEKHYWDSEEWRYINRRCKFVQP